MKKILSILMIALTVFFMVIPVTAVDGEENELEVEWSDYFFEEFYTPDEDLESFDLVHYDPVINFLNENDCISEPGFEEYENTVSPYSIRDTEEDGIDIKLNLTELAVENLQAQDDGECFKNIINVEEGRNLSYLSVLLNQKYPNCTDIRVYSQGSCSDGEYIYYALIVQYDFNGKNNDQENCIVSGYFNEDDAFVTTAIRFASDMIDENCLTQKYALKHMNGIAYNSLHDKLVIAGAEAGYHNEVYIMDAAYFRGETNELPSYEKKELSCRINSIAYNERINKYIAMVAGTDRYFVYFDSDFNLINGFNTIKDKKPYEATTPEISHQDICCDDNYIYATYFWNSAGENQAPDTHNVIIICDLMGNVIHELTLEIPSVTSVEGSSTRTSDYEIESISILNDRIVLGFNVFWRNAQDPTDKTIYAYQYDMSDLCFNIKYCPDDNVVNYVNSDNLKNNTVIHGIKTNLLKNTYMKNGYKFVGWHLYSPRNGKWRYWKDVEAPGKDLYDWFIPGTEPDGYVKVIYNESTSVKQTVPAGWDLLLCTVWEETDKFYISYDGNGATSGLMDVQEITYGQTKPLDSNEFQKVLKSGQSINFEGWNIYSEETAKWYYENIYDSTQRGWYIEGEQPEGYKKTVYTNGGNVKQTVNPGGHIRLVALWNEFKIYYDANGKLIHRKNIKFPTVVYKGIQTDLNKYNTALIYSYAHNIAPLELNGYHQYIIESGSWRYYNEQGGTFWSTQPNLNAPLYIYTSDTISNGLNAGWHVVFRADWLEQ